MDKLLKGNYSILTHYYDPPIEDKRRAANTVAVVGQEENPWQSVKVLDLRPYVHLYSVPIGEPLVIEFNNIRLTPAEARELGRFLLSAANTADEFRNEGSDTQRAATPSTGESDDDDR